MSRFNELNNRVIEWAYDKGILDKATPLSQHDKTQEEIDELLEALKFQGLEITDYENTKGIVCRTDHEIKDALGDILVTFNISCNEWQGKYYTTLQAWKIFKADSTPLANSEPLAIEDDGEGLPF